MIYRLICLILSIIVFSTLNAQKAISWQALNDVSWKRTFVKDMDGYYDIPVFGDRIKDLNSK